MEKKLTQQQRILNHMLKGNDISPLEACQFPFSCPCLYGVIKKLRKQGYNIHAHRNPDENFNRYYIPTEKKAG